MCLLILFFSSQAVWTCLECVSGKYLDSKGSISEDNCDDCEQGTYQTEAGASFCHACVAGKYSTTLQASFESACVPCVAGKYSTTISAAVSDVCQDCVEGKYLGTTGNDEEHDCIKCPKGSWGSFTMRTSLGDCILCDMGKHSCATGAISSGTCESCSAGKYLESIGSGDPSDCVPCVSGKFSPNEGATSGATCQDCGPGTYLLTEGNDEFEDCLRCDKGKYLATSTASVLCSGSCACSRLSGAASGSISDGPSNYDNNERCEWIIAAESADANIWLSFSSFDTESGSDFVTIYSCLTSSCTSKSQVARLSGNALMTSGNTSYTSPTGYMHVIFTTDSILTRSGFVAQWTVNVDVTGCVDCAAGKYSTQHSATSDSTCQDCVAGKYLQTAGNDEEHDCIECGAGKYSIVTASSSGATCQDCLANTYLETQGSASPDKCVACATGKYSAASSVSATFCMHLCGDGILAGSEACDDGNKIDDDGCGSTCATEPGWACTTTLEFGPTICKEVCGNDIRTPGERCDDGNTADMDGCSDTCTVEYGYKCDGTEPQTCMIDCGDGILVGQEACDDHNTDDGDGCSSTCVLESAQYWKHLWCSSTIATSWSALPQFFHLCQATGDFDRIARGKTCMNYTDLLEPFSPSGPGIRTGSVYSRGELGVTGGVISKTVFPVLCPEGVSGEDCQPCELDLYSSQCSESCDMMTDCTGHGRCVGRTGQCKCFHGWSGKFCNIVTLHKVFHAFDADRNNCLSLSEFLTALIRDICLAGNNGKMDCMKCDKGKYLTTLGNYLARNCVDCPAGKFSPVLEATSQDTCESCIAGKFLETEGNDESRDCIECEAGKYSIVMGSSSVDTCQDCLANTYLETQGNVNLQDCLLCVKGKYSVPGSASATSCLTVCGDGIRAGAEDCDDGNAIDDDGCGITCATGPGWVCTITSKLGPTRCVEVCGNNITTPGEECDDGNTVDFDGCSDTCEVEYGYTCDGAEPQLCMTTCGDGILAEYEVCDDGNTFDGDGCSSTCVVESGEYWKHLWCSRTTTMLDFSVQTQFFHFCQATGDFDNIARGQQCISYLDLLEPMSPAGPGTGTGSEYADDSLSGSDNTSTWTLEQMFRGFDTNRDGCLSRFEFETARTRSVRLGACRPDGCGRVEVEHSGKWGTVCGGNTIFSKKIDNIST